MKALGMPIILWPIFLPLPLLGLALPVLGLGPTTGPAPDFSVPASSEEVPRNLEGVAFEQLLGKSVQLERGFRNEHGESVRLADLLGDKPAILVMAYYKCPGLCTSVLNGLAQSIKDLPFKPGKDYRIVTVSIRPQDTHRLALAKKRSYLAKIGLASTDDTSTDWSFLTGDESEIRALAGEIGFRYSLDPVSGEYSHPSGIVLLTPQGRISRYFFGIQYPSFDLRLALVEASSGKISSPIDQLLLFCFHYDPRSGKYGPTVLSVLRILGIITVLCLLGAWLYLTRSRRPEGPVDWRKRA